MRENIDDLLNEIEQSKDGENILAKIDNLCNEVNSSFDDRKKEIKDWSHEQQLKEAEESSDPLILSSLVSIGNPEISKLVASNPHASSALIEALMENSSNYRNIARNPSTSLENLDRLAQKNSNALIKAFIARNPNATDLLVKKYNLPMKSDGAIFDNLESAKDWIILSDNEVEITEVESKKNYTEAFHDLDSYLESVTGSPIVDGEKYKVAFPRSSGGDRWKEFIFGTKEDIFKHARNSIELNPQDVSYIHDTDINYSLLQESEDNIRSTFGDSIINTPSYVEHMFLGNASIAYARDYSFKKDFDEDGNPAIFEGISFYFICGRPVLKAEYDNFIVSVKREVEKVQKDKTIISNNRNLFGEMPPDLKSASLYCGKIIESAQLKEISELVIAEDNKELRVVYPHLRIKLDDKTTAELSFQRHFNTNSRSWSLFFNVNPMDSPESAIDGMSFIDGHDLRSQISRQGMQTLLSNEIASEIIRLVDSANKRMESMGGVETVETKRNRLYSIKDKYGILIPDYFLSDIKFSMIDWRKYVSLEIKPLTLDILKDDISFGRQPKDHKHEWYGSNEDGTSVLLTDKPKVNNSDSWKKFKKLISVYYGNWENVSSPFPNFDVYDTSSLGV